ncbi:MAG: histidinol-phosphate transaminase [Candidatus Lokiarchaeota archaeon]|nr:histidinol-phosphate transaminase [Candidatus Lokiarchaeota archaeon]
MELNELLRKSLRKYSAYEPGEQPTEDGWLKLNTNENPFPPIPEILKDIKSAINEKLRLYPDPTSFELRKEILNVLLRDKDTLTNRNSIFIGNGSDEVLDVIFKIFIDPGDEVVIFYPTYGFYKVLGTLYNAKITEIQLTDDFSIPDSAFNAKGKLMFINSPNNPNGKSVDNETILKLCESFPGIVLVDEAYADFSNLTCLSLLKKVKNLIVNRSFSKSFSLASLRMGYALADPEIIKEMNRVKLPYNTNYLGQIAALSCIKHSNKIFERNKKIIEERDRLTEILNKFEGISVLPSDSNFIFIKFEDKSKTLQFVWDLKEMKILVRHFSKPGLYNYIRVTIGMEEDNNKFIEAFQKIADKYL